MKFVLPLFGLLLAGCTYVYYERDWGQGPDPYVCESSQGQPELQINSDTLRAMTGFYVGALPFLDLSAQNTITVHFSKKGEYTCRKLLSAIKY